MALAKMTSVKSPLGQEVSNVDRLSPFEMFIRDQKYKKVENYQDL